jgi:hypothetical protein
MPENETVALAEDLLFRERAMWLLIRALGGEVSITDKEWERVPERPELILDRSYGVMRWTAREPEKASDFIPGFIPGAEAESDPSELPGQLPLPGTEAGDA